MGRGSCRGLRRVCWLLGWKRRSGRRRRGWERSKLVVEGRWCRLLLVGAVALGLQALEGRCQCSQLEMKGMVMKGR